MNIINTKISDVKIIEPEVFCDDRGFFMEIWNKKKYTDLVDNEPINFVQDNHSSSKKDTLRGLHFQRENSQGKLVHVTHGEVFDVAVDIRKNSSTYGHWVGVYLSAKNKRQLWIPEGFAHGFIVTSSEADFVYKCTDYYNPESEVTIKWNDEDIGIVWPLQGMPILSKKDEFNSIDFKGI